MSRPTVVGAAPHAVTLMPMRRVVGAYVAELRFETIRMLRTPAFAVPFAVIPIALYLFFGLLAAGATDRPTPPNPNTPFYLFTGFSVMGVIGPGLFGFGMSIALEREQGLLRLKRALPMPPVAYLLAKMGMAMLFSAFVSLAVTVLAVVVRDLPISLGRAAAVVAIETLGTLPFCAIGLFIGARVSGRVAPAVVNVVYLPMIYLSGLFFPLPESIRAVALFSPAFHLNQLALGAAGIAHVMGAAGPMMSIAALVGVTVLFTGLTVRRLATSI